MTSKRNIELKVSSPNFKFFLKLQQSSRISILEDCCIDARNAHTSICDVYDK